MVETISARPLTFDDVVELAQPDAAPLIAYQPHHVYPHLHVQVTVTPQKGGTTRKNPKPVIRDGQELGLSVTVATLTEYGSHSGGALFTNADVEAFLASERGRSHPERLRTSLFVAAPAGHPKAFPLPLVPKFGSQVSASIFVAGLNPDEARERLEKAVRAEFGDDTATVRCHNMKARPVADVRVDVIRVGGTEVIAANVLDAEASYYADGANWDVRPATIRVGY